MRWGSIGLRSVLMRFAARLRFPTLFWLTVAILALDLVVPDVVPFVDEIALTLTALVLANLRKRLRTRAD
jgi:hypothetical protein